MADHYFSELLTRPEVRNFAKNQEFEVGMELDQLAAVAPYIVCNKIVNIRLSHEPTPHRVSAIYEIACRSLIVCIFEGQAHMSL